MYSRTLLDHFMNPRNVGEVRDLHGVGRVKSRTCQDLLEITVHVGEDGALTTGFRAQACSACIAAASMLTELVNEGRLDAAAARSVDLEQLVERLDGVPEAKLRCVEMSPIALDRALRDAGSPPS